MTFKTPSRLGLAGLTLGVLFALCLCFIAFDVAFAEMAAPPAGAPAAAAAAEPTVNKGDTAWMLSATVFVLLMTIPGLALFYGGLVRTKNMLSVLMWVFYSVCIVTILWAVVGYSLVVSRKNLTYVDDIKTLIGQLHADHARVIGTVLNEG